MSEPQAKPICAVLIVEDDQMVREILVDSLHNKPVHVIEVSSLEEARLALKFYFFDVVLLDNMLQDGMGIELMADIEAMNQPPLVLMITSTSDPESINYCFQQGVHDYMVKPVNNDLLWAKIQRSFEFVRRGRQLIKQHNELETLLAEKASEEELAQYVYASLAHTEAGFPEGITVKEYYNGQFSGDLVAVPACPEDRAIVFLADAMGHGLQATFCILPVINVVRAMAAKGKPLDEIFHEVNRSLHYNIPDDRFVALAGIEINWPTGTISAINAGLPSLIVGRNDATLAKIKSDSVPLGIMPPSDFTVTTEYFSVNDVTQIALLTDGITEQKNFLKESMSAEQYDNAALILLSKQGNLSGLMEVMMTHADGCPIEDDATICVLDINAMSDARMRTISCVKNDVEAPFSLELVMQGGLIGKADLLNIALSVMKQVDLAPEVRQRAFTALAELINNAIDHGVLGLDSALKNDIEGFASFLEEREKRMADLTENDQIMLNLRSVDTGRIIITVEDTGPGFDAEKLQSESDALSGRGLKLLNSLCDSVMRNAKGNSTTIILSRI